MQGCYRKSGDFLRGKAEQEIVAVLDVASVSHEEEQAASETASEPGDGGLVPFAVARAQFDGGAVIFLEQIGEPGVVRLVALVEHHDGDCGLRARVRFKRAAVDKARRGLANSGEWLRSRSRW